MTAHNPTIPPPATYRVITQCQHQVMAVTIHGTSTGHSSGETRPRITFSVTHGGICCDTAALNTMISDRTPASMRKTASAKAPCSGTPPHGVEVSVTGTGIPAILEAITRFYSCETRQDTPTALRSVYQQLSNPSATKE